MSQLYVSTPKANGSSQEAKTERFVYGICGEDACLSSTLITNSLLYSTITLHKKLDNGSPGKAWPEKCEYALTLPVVNDVCIHPNQGELISCDQAGNIKQWDLS